MGTQSVTGGKRVDGFSFSADVLKIAGYDDKSGPGHRLWCVRVPTLAPDPRLVESMVLTGRVTSAIKFEMQGDEPYVVDGRNRVVACRAANIIRAKAGLPPIMVPATKIEKGLSDADVSAIITTANVHVQNKAMQDAHEVARKKAEKVSIEDIAKLMGVHPQSIRNYESLLKLHKDIQDALDEEKIERSAAYKLTGLSKTMQLKVYRAALDANDTSARAVDALIKSMNRGTAESEEGGEEDGGGEGEGGGEKAKKETVKGKYPRPSVTEIRKLVKYLEAHADELSADKHQMLRWMIGDVSTRSVTGLAPVMRAAGLVKSD